MEKKENKTVKIFCSNNFKKILQKFVDFSKSREGEVLSFFVKHAHYLLYTVLQGMKAGGQVGVLPRYYTIKCALQLEEYNYKPI